MMTATIMVIFFGFDTTTIYIGISYINFCSEFYRNIY